MVDEMKEARHWAHDWWAMHPDERTALCERCHGELKCHEGYLVEGPAGPDLICEKCFDSKRDVGVDFLKYKERMRTLGEEYRHGAPTDWGEVGCSLATLVAVFVLLWWWFAK